MAIINKDFLLSSEHDLLLVNNDLSFTDAQQLTVQKLKQTLLLFSGEWFLNNNVGLPYLEEIFGKNVSLSRIETIYIRAIQSIPEVVEIVTLNVNINSASRTLSVDFEVRDNQSNLISMTV